MILHDGLCSLGKALFRDASNGAAVVVVEISCTLAPQRSEKISNNSSFGIIDIADRSSASDRIIVIVNAACLIDDGAYR